MATVNLTWDDVNSGSIQEDGLRLYRSSSPFDTGTLPAVLTTLAVDVEAYSDTTAPDTFPIYYMLEAFSATYGSAFSSLLVVTDTAEILTFVAQEVRSVGSAFSINNTPRFVPWATQQSFINLSMIDGADNTVFNMPATAKYATVSAKVRVGTFDQNYVSTRVFLNGVQVANSQLYNQGWHPGEITWAGAVEENDTIQIQVFSDDGTLQAVNQSRECWIKVGVYS